MSESCTTAAVTFVSAVTTAPVLDVNGDILVAIYNKAAAGEGRRIQLTHLRTENLGRWPNRRPVIVEDPEQSLGRSRIGRIDDSKCAIRQRHSAHIAGLLRGVRDQKIIADKALTVRRKDAAIKPRVAASFRCEDDKQIAVAERRRAERRRRVRASLGSLVDYDVRADNTG